jgi:hypothetical protein
MEPGKCTWYSALRTSFTAITAGASAHKQGITSLKHVHVDIRRALHQPGELQNPNQKQSVPSQLATHRSNIRRHPDGAS